MIFLALGLSVLLIATPASAAFYLHGTGPTANPPTLFLDDTNPTATTAKYRDSVGVNFSGGNLWKEIGTWTINTTGTLTELNNLHVWLGLKNSDDIGTRFDLRAEVYRNGQSLITSGELYCIQNITRNPDLAKEVVVSFGSFSPADFGSGDVLSLRILTRIGTDGAGAFCGGHSNAVGLRLYFDAVSRPSGFDATLSQNSAPVANAGQDQQVRVGDLVTLDGRNSYDPDGDLITYNWTITSAPSGSNAALDNPISVMPTFVPDKPGNYVVLLTVNDGKVDSSPDDAIVIAAQPNVAPTAIAGPDQSVATGSQVLLDGQGSFDPDGDPLTYQWQMMSLPTGSTAFFDNPASPTPTFVADKDGQYVIVLTVNDGELDSLPDDVIVISATPNAPPVAFAGDDQIGSRNTMINLNASGSYDPENNPLTYAWSIVSSPEGSTSQLDDPTSPTPTILADREGDYVFRLVVFDGQLCSEPDTVVVRAVNNAPIAKAGPDKSGIVGVPVIIDGSGSSDPNGDTLTYQWSIVSAPSGSMATISNPTSATCSFTPDLPGAYTIQLMVNDGWMSSVPDTAGIEVIQPNQNPVANPGGPYTGVVGVPVQFDGSGSGDPDGDPITSNWDFGDGATGSGVTPVHTYSSLGQYTVTLTVQDNKGGSGSAQTTANINNPIPSLSSINPTSIIAGSPGFTLTLSGENFLTTSIVSFNNQQYSATYLSKTQIEATIPSSAVATAGSYPVKVINPAPGGGETSSLTFTVQPSEQPPETPQSGYINGRIFDVSTRTPLPGVLVTLRDVQGAVLTNGEGQFALPTPTKGRYLLTTEKPGYAYGQRWVEVMSQRDMVIDPLYLMALDPQATTITSAGGTHLSADGKVEVVIPSGAVSAPIEVVTTDVMKSESLPAPLPPTSLFTYCVNLRPDDATFATQVRVRIKNYLNFPAGTSIPVGFYSKKEARWLNHGMSAVTADGQWVEFHTDHFSWYDCNSPGLMQRPPANITRNSQPRNQVCEESKDVGKSRIGIKSGNLGIEHKLPSYRSLGTTKDLELVYNSTTAKPSALISFESEIDPSQSTVPPTITYNLRIEGNMTAARFIGERGKAYWGYVFDGINGRGQRLPTGVYPYRLDLSYDYSTAYALTNFFGGPALDSTGVPTRERIPFTTSLDDFLVISNQVDSPFGAGWSLKELNRLYLQPDGNLVLVEGNGNAKAVFKRDDISNPLKVDENTILLYQFDGRENRAIDATGRFNGTFYGEAHLVSEGKFGAGATFDGDRDYIRIGNVGAPPQGTVEAWVYFPKGPGINTSYLMIANGGNEYGANWDCPFDLGVHYGWGGDLRFGLWSGGWQWAASGVTPAQLAGGWHHIAGTWGSKGVEIWIDGERKGYNSYTGGFSCPNYPTVFVGTDSWTWDFNGIIDDFRISNIQRSPGMASYSPLNDYSLIVRNADGTYTRTLKDGVKINFNAEGLHTSTVDRNGNTTSYSYNQGGLLTSITDPTGLVTTFGYDGNGRLSSITDPAGRTTQVGIDAQGNLASITNADGTPVSYAYDADHLLVAKTDPRGFATQYIYDGYHRISEVRTADGGTTRYRPYDVQGLINDLPQGTGTFDNPAPLIKPSDIQVNKTDARGQTTYYKVNSFGTLNEINDPLGRVTKQEFDKAGNLTKTIRPDGSQILMTYDGKGNLLTRTDPLNHITRFSYEPQFNQITSITDALSRVTNFGYDAKGNLTTITNALGKVTSIGYDTRGLMASITDPLSQITTFNYDATGNLSSVKDPLENITAFGYDSAGNVISMTDAEGRTTQYQYDQHNRLVQVADALGGTTTYQYQTGCPDCARSDLLTSLSDANGNTTSFSYDGMGRVIGIADPLGFQKLFYYDLNGNLISQTDPNGNTITYAYDLANRLTGKTMPGDVETYGYDAVDNLTSAADNDSSIAMGYDPAGRLTSVTTGGSVLPVATISYTYDANGNRVSMVDVQNGVTSYQYDVLNRLVSLTDPQAEAVSFTYDFLNRRTGVTLPNGVQTGYSYDAANRLLSLVHQISGVNIESLSYAHDKVGNRTSMTDLSGTHAYGYDNLYRLISAAHPQPANPAELYTFDPVGNRLSSAQHPSWSYDTDNRLLSFNGTSFAYDNNGNMISRTDQTGTTTYQYDAENRLVGINKPDGAVIGYRYDPFGRRIEKNVNGTITRYLYDGESILYELDGSDTILARHTHGPGIDEPLIMKRAGASYYYHGDGLGSITQITDATSSIVASYVYSAFGEIIAQSGGLANSYTYTGREYDPESGLYYYRARYYDAKIGRFLQTDPIGFGGGDVNLYGYVQNNPINRVDPWGLMWSGAGVTVLGQLISGGGTAGLYRIQNWSTGQQCIIAVYGGGLGGGLGGSINAESIWIWNAPASADLEGTVNAVVVYGGWGATGVGGGSGKGGCSKDIVSRNDIPDPSKSSSVNFGAGLGGGGGYIVGSFTTKVLHCW
jgi:RHS repeat-associated protein